MWDNLLIIRLFEMDLFIINQNILYELMQVLFVVKMATFNYDFI